MRPTFRFAVALAAVAPVLLGVLAAGAVVQEGAELAQIACAGERLQAELTLSQGGLSRTRPGLPVKLLYESFPYQRFGVRNGTLRWASPSSAMRTSQISSHRSRRPA